MAAKVGAPEFGTISRFSVLAKSDSDSSQDESVKDKNVEGKKKGKNAKKRARKKKKAAADSAAAGELREMAFNWPTKHTKSQNVTKPLVSHADEKLPSMEDLEWIERDEKFIVNQFQENLLEALKLSMEEANHHEVPIDSRMDLKSRKKKDLPVKLSLEEFQKKSAEPEEAHSIWYDHKNKEVEGFETMAPPLPSNPENVPKKGKKRKGKKGGGTEKSKVATDTEEAVKPANGHDTINSLTHEYSLDQASINHWINEVDKRSSENEILTRTIAELKEELARVKRRNKQLCFILGQGEMREKSEILQQVDVLTTVKDELSLEIADLHTLLEQERSKVSSLKLDLAKYQNGRTKKQSTSEN